MSGPLGPFGSDAVVIIGRYHDHDATGAGKCLDVQGKSITAGEFKAI